MVKNDQPYMLLAKSSYAVLFVVAIPLLLLGWAIALQGIIRWSVPNWPLPGLIMALIGLALTLKAMRDLVVHGHGLPMNAFPPEKWVTQGAYAWFSHPIYLGAVMVAAGASLWFQSSSGLYLITPMLALMTLALVYGYERLAVRRRFGDMVSQNRPLFALPLARADKATWPKKIAMVVRLLLPFLIGGYLIDYAGCGAVCSGPFMQLFDPQQWQRWWEIAWIAPLIYVLARILFARDRQQMLHFVIAGTLATMLGLYWRLVLPAFGVDMIHSRLVLAVVNSLTVVFALKYRAVWSGLQRLCEWVANSRHDWLLFDGKVRIINHSVYAFGCGVIGIALGGHVLGNAGVALMAVACAMLGAAVYAQLSWGGGALLRPLGFWGGVMGVAVGMALAQLLFQISPLQVALASVLSIPFGQALGRFRCLTQGCCHGIATDERFGIRVWQPQSRVVLRSGLKGQWILITQLYSILANLLLGPFLLAMWLSKTLPMSMIVGAYLVLTGIERFAEDGYRGETQTRTIKGLKEPQWFSLLALLLGALFTILPSSPALPPAIQFDLLSLAAVLAGGFLTAFVMSIDFPESTLRFSRLSG